MRYYFELLKLFIAYSLVYGTMILPVPIFLAAVLKYNQPWMYFVAFFASIPLGLYGIYTSFKLSRWFLVNWGKQHLE